MFGDKFREANCESPLRITFKHLLSDNCVSYMFNILFNFHSCMLNIYDRSENLVIYKPVGTVLELFYSRYFLVAKEKCYHYLEYLLLNNIYLECTE